MLILDLYFFRPPGVKRLTKENVNDTITRKTEGNRKYIREKNGGICDIENAEYSFCTTDMNTTTDLENNILTYEEEAIMNITTDSQNSYIKTKNTKLVDITKNVENLNVKTYEKNLNNILNKLNPYLKNEVLFSNEDFNEVYIVNKYGMNAFKKSQKRNLAQEARRDNMIKKENNLFNFFSPETGVNFDISLFNNMGINSDFMEANSKLYIENNKTEYISISKESSRNFTQILKELTFLSDAGNHLATQLYQKTNISLENMTEEIEKAITILNDLIKYKDLSEIFDSTLSLDALKDLPFVIIQESSSLKKKLDELLKNIEDGGINPNLKILNKNIYEYIEESHNIIYLLFTNLEELSSSLSSSKSKLTEISTYYLNHTSTSYVTTIKKAQNILSNYYKDEFNLIKPQIDKILEIFEEKLTESLQKEIKIIDNLYEKIENKNFTIRQANDEDIKTILNNLYYIKNFMKEVIEKIKEKVRKEMNIKPNGYFITDYDLNTNEETFSKIIEKASKISTQLDNDELIDTKFDEVMGNIKNNFTSIIKNMEKQKEELFPLNEDVLKESSFTSEIQNEMKNSINELGVDILNKIRRENSYYLELKQKVIDEFLANNKEFLNNLTLELDTLFSAVKLEELANLYENAFKSCLEKTKNEIKSNELLSNEYFNSLIDIVQDNNKLIELLKSFHIDPQHLVQCLSRRRHHEIYLTYFTDSISSKIKTEGYLIKYNSFKDRFEKSKLYINEQLYPELLSEYKNILSKIREILQVFKNNKISNIYPDLEELSFIDENIRTIDNFYNRLNQYISDDIFNNKYIKLMNDYKISESSEITNISNNIKSKHSILDNLETANDFNYDFCLSFIRKKVYTCVNGAVFTYTNSDYYCLPLSTLSNNHLKLLDHSIYSDDNLIQFHSKFNEFYDILSKKILTYTSKIDALKESLSKIEIETINKGFTLDYLTPINNKVNSLLSNKYGEEIIKSAYNYYQPNIKTRIEPLLNDISSQWYKFFDDLKIDIENNLDNFKNSIIELSNFASFYLSVLSTNITNNYFDSINMHQKTEFNYTISYYYNLLIRHVKSSHQYIISKIPTNKVGFNNLVNKRKNEINNFFNNLIKNINDSFNEALNIDQQTMVLQVAETNFFKINDILKNNVLTTQKSLNEKLVLIRKLKNNKYNDEFSFAARFYLENSQSGKQIEQFYEQIEQKVFVYLNLDKFKDLLIDNWIFDQDEFIKSLNITLYNLNLEIEKEFKTEKEKYMKTFEEEITKYYNEDEITKKINGLYKNEVKELQEDQIKEIMKNINEILEKIKQHFTEEAKRLKGTMVSYNKDYSKIEERIKTYQESINQKVKEAILSAINDFYSNMKDKLYTKYFEHYLDEYIKESEDTAKEFGIINLFSSSYNVGEIILNIIKYFSNKYKQYIKSRINTDYEEYYSKLENKVDIKGITNLINEKISEAYNNILLTVLKEVATYEIGITQYTAYDLGENILNDIDSTINNKTNNIKNIIDSIKGSDFEINLKNWKIFDYSRIYDKVRQNCNNLRTFFYSQKENEKEVIDLFLKDIMLSNFNDLLQNIIPSFGNQFFERIIKYNENFKITSLYNNLKYSLIPTMGYYLSLHSSAKLRALTKDIKLKIYSLNDLDLVAQEKNKEVLDLLNKKVNEFIEDSKEFLIGKYKEFFKNDVSIEHSFNETIYNEIIEILYSLENDFDKSYLDLMNKYLKDKLISSYTKVMNDKTADMVLSVVEKREMLKSKIDDIFSLEPDYVLNDINNKINNTLRYIDKFNTHFITFKISENFVDFLNDYGKNNIQPKFDGILDILNQETKNKITDTIGKNSKNYIDYFNDKEFIEKSNNTITDIDKKYIKNINESIEEYGKDNYPNNLEIEIGRQTKRNRRRLERLLTEEEIENEHKEKIADKAIDDTFSKLLNSSNYTKRFIYSFEKFNEFDKIINENINKLNTAYKFSLKRIKDNNYVEQTYNNLTTILSQLKQITLDYYKNINNSFYILKTELKNSIDNIDDNLNQCANITYITFAKKYEDISNVDTINSTTNEIDNNVEDSYIVENQNKITTVNYTISNILKKTKFIFDYNYEIEGNIRKPKLKAYVINQSRPGKIYIKFINTQPSSGDIIERVEVEPNDVNFTININYNTSTGNLLYITTIVDFESYKYSREVIQMFVEEKENWYIIDGIPLPAISYEYTEDNPKILYEKKDKTVEKQTVIEESIVNKDIFNFI